MAIDVNGTDIENIVVETATGQTELDEVYVNDVLVWQRTLNDQYILKEKPTPNYGSTTPSIRFNVATGNNPCTIYCRSTDGTVVAQRTIAENTALSSVIFTEVKDGEEYEIEFVGGFIQVQTEGDYGGSRPSRYSAVTDIVKWPSKIHQTYEQMFAFSTIYCDITIPEYITRVVPKTFLRTNSIGIYNDYRNLNLHSNIVEFDAIGGYGISGPPCSNAVLDGDFYMVDDVCVSLQSSKETLTIPEKTRVLAARLLTYDSSRDGSISGASVSTLVFPANGKFTEIPYGFAEGCGSLSVIDIPHYIRKIGSKAFSVSSLSKVTFNIPAGVSVDLPQAGSDTGVFYNKSVRQAEIYTDNEDIKNYAWATDNVTATLYHLDGTLWEA